MSARSGEPGAGYGSSSRRPGAPGGAAVTASLALALAAGIGLGAGCTPRVDPDTIPDAYRYSTAALMWPGATRAFQVTPAGDLFNGAWNVRVRPAAAGAPAEAPRVIAYEERWRPVAHWVRTSGPVRWEFEAVPLPATGAAPFQAPEEAPSDSGLLVSLEVRARNSRGPACEATLELAFEAPDSSAAFLAFDAAGESPDTLRWCTAARGGIAHGWTSAPTSGGTTRISWSLKGGQQRTQRFVLSVYPSGDHTLANAARKSHSRWSAEARQYWDTQMKRGARFQLRDRDTENALRAALVVLLSCRERRGPEWVPIGSPLHYRDVWLRDGARAIGALSVMGHGDVARQLARGLVAYQWVPGAFFSQRGQPDGTGQALWAFEQAMLRPAADDSVAMYARLALLAWRWYEWQRELGRATGWRFGVMLPYAEPRDNEEARAQLVGTDAWAIAGYRATARLLRAAGRGAEAESVEASRSRYVSDFEAALDLSRSPDIPPSWQGVGRDWGNLAAAYPCAVLAPGDARCATVARRMWAAGGGAGLCSYARAESLHYYVGADLGTWALLAGARGAADSVLEAMLRWRSASGGAGEVFSRATRDYGKNLPPHVTSAAALIALIRNAIVFDADDTLRLTLGARDRWWRGSRVQGAPTRWGTLDLRFRRRGQRAEWSWTAVPVWTSLTLPPGTHLSAQPPAPLVRGPSPEIVLAPPGTRRARVALAGAGP